MSKKAKGAKKNRAVPGRTVVSNNRRARHDYEILDTFEAGIALVGSEVKSLRAGKAVLSDAYARIENGECWLFAMHIPPYSFATGFGSHDPDRKRKLLLHRRELDKIAAEVAQQSLTLVPLSAYFVETGIAKIDLAIARGRKTYDKRRALAERDTKREESRALSGRMDRD